jgi:hypothetical protein
MNFAIDTPAGFLLKVELQSEQWELHPHRATVIVTRFDIAGLFIPQYELEVRMQ